MWPPVSPVKQSLDTDPGSNPGVGGEEPLTQEVPSLCHQVTSGRTPRLVSDVGTDRGFKRCQADPHHQVPVSPHGLSAPTNNGLPASRFREMVQNSPFPFLAPFGTY